MQVHLRVVAFSAILLGLCTCLMGGCLLLPLANPAALDQTVQDVLATQPTAFPGGEKMLREVLVGVLVVMSWLTAVTGALLVAGGAGMMSGRGWGRWLMVPALLLLFCGSGLMTLMAGLQALLVSGPQRLLMLVQAGLAGFVLCYTIYAALVVRSAGRNRSELQAAEQEEEAEESIEDPEAPWAEDEGLAEGRW